MDVEMPDGTVIEDVPEGVTQAELLRRYQKSSRPASVAKPSTSEALGMGLRTSILPDLAMGARQAIDAGAQMATRGLSAMGVIPESEAKRVEQINLQALDAYKQNFGPDSLTKSITRGAGGAMVTAPLMPALGATGLPGAIAGGAGLGALGSSAVPVYDVPEGSSFGTEKAKQAGMGALFGGGLGAAGNLASRFINPHVQKGARELLDADVRLTPGQTFGGTTNYLEQKISNIPGPGNIVQNARKQAFEDFNRSLYRRALEPWGRQGETVAKQVTVGHEGIAKVGDFISDRYEDALSRSVPSPLDRPFGAAFQKVRSMVPSELRGKFDEIVNQHVTLTPTKTITPSALKQADSALGREAAGYRGSEDFDKRKLAEALHEVQSQLRQMFARNNPTTAAEIRAADQGWRTLVQLENAGSMIGSKDGVITPANFVNAVKRSDKSLRDRMFARGEAFNQAFAEDAKRVLPATVPESGTPGGIAVLGALTNPVTAAKAGMAVAPAMAMYAPGASAAFRALLTKRPEGAEAARALLGQAAPYLGLLSGGLLSHNQ